MAVLENMLHEMHCIVQLHDMHMQPLFVIRGVKKLEPAAAREILRPLSECLQILTYHAAFRNSPVDNQIRIHLHA